MATITDNEEIAGGAGVVRADVAVTTSFVVETAAAAAVVGRVVVEVPPVGTTVAEAVTDGIPMAPECATSATVGTVAVVGAVKNFGGVIVETGIFSIARCLSRFRCTMTHKDNRTTKPPPRIHIIVPDVATGNRV